MAAIDKTTVSRAGGALTFRPAAVGDTVIPGDGTCLVVKNGAVGAVTVTVVTPGTTHGLAIADQTAVVAPGAEAIIGPIASELFKDSADGLAHVNYSSLTTITVAAFTL